MPRITLTRQVTGSDQVTLAPGEHEVSDFEANLYRMAGWTDQPPEKPQEVAALPALAPALIDIPDGWEALHGLQQARLASEIAGRKVTAKQAGEVIRAEIARRNG